MGFQSIYMVVVIKISTVELLVLCLFDMLCNENESSSLSSPNPRMVCRAFNVASTELL